MPLVDFDPSGFNTSPADTRIEPEVENGSVWGAAFRLENDMVNVWELLTRPKFEPQEGFNPAGWLKEQERATGKPLWSANRDIFLGVRSADEAVWMASKIAQEEKDQETLARAGWAGVAAAVFSGIMSPTMFIPAFAPGRGLRAVGGAVALGAGAGAAQELPLQAAQETRTTGETVFGIGASAVVGGILGGAVAYLTREEVSAIERGMVNTPGGSYVSAPFGASGGAAVREAPSAGNLASGAVTASRVLDSNPLSRSPVTDAITQTIFPRAQQRMAQTHHAGLAMEGNARGIATNPGGTISDNILPYHGQMFSALEKSDDAYTRHVFGDADVPTLMPSIRARVAGFFGKGKLAVDDFYREVGRAMFSSDVHVVPEVAEAAKTLRAEIFEFVEKRAKAAQILDPETKLVGDKSYANRLWDLEKIKADEIGFIDFLTRKGVERMEMEFLQGLKQFKTSQKRTEELIQDIEIDPDIVEEVAATRRAELDKLEDQLPEEVVELEDQLRTLRTLARDAREWDQAATEQWAFANGRKITGDWRAARSDIRKDLLRQARELQSEAGDDYAGLRSLRADLRRRLSNLNKSVVLLGERQAKKLEKVERSEELQLNTLKRAVAGAQKFLGQLDKLSDRALGTEVSKLKDRFESVARVYDSGEERIHRLAINESDPTVGKILGEEALQQDRAVRMTALAERLEEAEGVFESRPVLRQIVEEGLSEALEKAQRINAKRAVRAQRLREQAEALDPSIARERVSTLRTAMQERKLDFVDRYRARGADALDVDAGTADFAAQARKDAEAIKDKILGTYIRLPTSEILAAERGPELARTLNFPTLEGEKWLELDARKMVRAYINTYAPDIEIKRVYGDVNGEQFFRDLGDDANNLKRAIEEDETLSQAQKDKEKAKITAEHARLRKDFEGVLGRLRHTHGLPKDPDGFAYRAATLVSNLNVLRLMGGTLISSIPDMARPIMKQGLVRTFRDGFVPLVTNLKTVKLNARETKIAGSAIETLTSARAMGLFDLFNDLGRRSKVERGIEMATGRMGIVAAFGVWTDVMKQFTGQIVVARLMDDLAEVMEGGKNAAKAAEYLAARGINGEYAAKIWAQVQGPGGGGKVDDLWYPNTEAWTDVDAKQAFRAALAGEVNNTIITPGAERPLWVDASIPGKLLAQFKSFALASTYRTVLAGMQQRDMAVVNGIAASLALGALSYYLYANAAGGKVKTEMLNAGVDKWADEAINRSGVLAVLAEVQRVGENISWTQPYVTLSGQRNTRRGGFGATDAVLGPSFDFMTTALGVVNDMSDPTQKTLHDARTLLPYQNLFLIRQFLDSIEANSGLPERRQ